MSREFGPNEQELGLTKTEVKPEYEGFVPDEFRQDPFLYFERQGKNIKSGDVQYDEEGRIKEDPTAVKDLPVWTNSSGAELRCVGKKVNTDKAMIGKSGDPFYEYQVMDLALAKGLPTPKPVARSSRGNEHLIVMERVPGIRWTDTDALHLSERGYSKDDIETLKSQAMAMMEELKERFDTAGIIRNWKFKDMIFDLDIENKKIRSITPTDWERTKIKQIE